MFAKGHRVTTEMFDEVMKTGKAYHVSHFTLRVVEEKGLSRSLFSVVTPKSVLKSAVLRNKLKRQMRTLLKETLPSSLTGYKALLFAKKGAPEMAYREIRHEIQMLCRTAGFLLE